MYRPTLVIGIGGTGTLVLQRLKRLINQKFGSGKAADLFQFLAIDTEPESQSNLSRLDINEFKNLTESVLRGNDIIQAMIDGETSSIYEGLRAWWPTYDREGKKPFLPGDITHGAKATRCIGRLAFWHHGIEIYRLLERKIRRTLQVSGLRREDVPSTGNTAKVFIICSLAGGSGSGMFLDITYMCRQLLANERLTGFVTGLLLADPSPFNEIVQEEGLRRRMEANIYAALSELDWLMGGHLSEEVQQTRQGALRAAAVPQAVVKAPSPWNDAAPPPTVSSNGASSSHTPLYEMIYPNRFVVRSSEKPFDICYMVTSTNEHSRRLQEVESLTEMIAQGIFLEMATPLGRTGRSQLDNVERLGAFSDYKARPLAYSSFAVASLNFTTELISRQAVLKLTELVIDRLLGRDAELLNGLLRRERAIAAPSATVDDLLQQLPPSAEQAIAALDTTAEIIDRLDIPEHRFSAGIQGGVYQAELLAYERSLDSLIEQFFVSSYASAEQSQYQVYRQVCDNLVRQLLGQRQLSLDEVIQLLNAQADQLDQVSAMAEQQRALAQNDVEAFRASVSEGMKRLDRALKGPDRQFGLFPTNKLQQVAGEARPIGDDMQRLAEGRRDVLRWRSAANVIGQTRQYLREHIGRLRQLRNDLSTFKTKIGGALNTSQSRLSRGSLQYQLEFEALSSDDVAGLVDNLVADTTPEELGRILIDLAATPDVKRRALTVDNHPLVQSLERIVAERLRVGGLPELLFQMNRSDTNRLERQLKRLVDYAEPFASLDLTRCPEVKQWSLIHLIGYDGAGRGGMNSLLSDTLTKLIDRFSPVNTENPNQIVFLKTKHGLPLFALAILVGMMRTSYHEHREAWLRGDRGYRPIHLSQQWARIEDFNPTSLEK